MSTLTVNYSFVFDFENNFERDYQTKWIREHYVLPFYTIIIYLAAIVVLKSFMKTRAAFDLRKLLVFWNSSLALFSVFGTIRAVPVLFFDLRVFGFHHSVCDSSNFVNASVFWAWLFTLSKFPELGDTLFIVLRKQKLIFLHWYHHVTVLVSSWFAFGELCAPARWMVTMNYVVHATMYSYYTLRALRMKIPRWIAMIITSMQIFQMLIGFYISVYVYFTRVRGIACDVSGNVANMFVIIYSSYFLLFLNYFYKTYIRSDTKKTQKED